MHKIHLITKPDGSLLVVAVLNPGMPWHYADTNKHELSKAFGSSATIVVVPYSTQVEVHDGSLLGAVRRWWNGRRLAREGEVRP